MEQLIFLGVIIIFSILESVARKNKKRQRPSGGGAPAPREPVEWRPEPDFEPRSYDSGPSYGDFDEEAEAPGQRRVPSSSEGMIPADIWEEIAGLAKGRTAPQAPPPVPAPSRPTSPARPRPARKGMTPSRAETVRRAEEPPPPPVETHRVHLSHREYGTDPSQRTRSEQDGLDPLATTVSGDTRSVRRQLKSHSAHALRRAVILQELLGPPAALRPDRFEE